MADPVDRLPYGVALLALGAGTLLVTFGFLGTPDVTYARARSTAWLSMALATIPILMYAAGKFGRPWWRALWTAGFLAYALHFWWAVFRTYNADFGAIIEHQGRFAGYGNFLATAIWLIDVILVWLPERRQRSIPPWVHFVATVWIAVAFFISSAFREGPIKFAGYAFLVLVILAVAARFHVFRDLFKIRRAPA